MMGINAAFSSWLRGAQSSATAALRAAQGYGATLQQQTITAVSVAQRAALQPIRQALQPRPSSRSPAAHTARTLTPVDAVTRAVSSGVRGVQEAAGQIVRAHAPIVQGVQRDIGRATQALPQAARSAPAAIQQGATQIARAHSPIMQGIQRDVGRAAQAIPAVSQIARAHAPIAQGLQRDAARVVSGGLGAATSAMNFANQRKAAAQAELTRTAGPAAPFEKGWTHPVYEWGREANKAYQGFVDTALPLYQRVQPLPNLPEIHSLQRGFARAPGSLLEGLSFIPPAAERGGQLLWKEPHKLPETAARFIGQQYEGMGAAFERDPYDFAGEMIGTVALSYGIGAAARPGAVARGSGATAPAPAPARTVAGGARSPGGTGSRFRSLEFGYRTEMIRKSAAPQKPFSVAEWQKERQKYAGGRAAIQVQETPLRTQAPTQPRADSGKGGASRQTSPPPESSRSRAVYGVPPLLTGHMPARVAPADPVVLPTTMPPGAPHLGGRGSPTEQAGRGARITSTSMTQDLASIEADVMAMIMAPPLLLAQPTATSMILQPRTDTKAQAAPPRPRQAPGGPPITVQPPRTTARGKDRKKKEEEERRRRKGKGEADHWEIGPAPGVEEMGMMIFGAGRRSALDLLPGTSVLNLGGSPRTPAKTLAKTLAKKPAHAGEVRKKRGKATKKKK